MRRRSRPGGLGTTVPPATGNVLHPWWRYVAGPPGAVPGVLYAAGIGRPRSWVSGVT
ncbi:MAG TPA: hypothetical protein VGO95_13590 [Modestobacter sp.]|nr:hypothetical protein [Modestobacter sp.]